MSYDITIAGEDFNYTSNVGCLFYEHIPPSEYGGRGGIHAINGKTGREAFDILSDAFDRIDHTRHVLWRDDMVGDPVMCARYDAPNGWGSLIGALIFLAKIMAACARSPRSKVRVYA